MGKLEAGKASVGTWEFNKVTILKKETSIKHIYLFILTHRSISRRHTLLLGRNFFYLKIRHM
jgi:hypothetical protein